MLLFSRDLQLNVQDTILRNLQDAKNTKSGNKNICTCTNKTTVDGDVTRKTLQDCTNTTQAYTDATGTSKTLADVSKTSKTLSDVIETRKTLKDVIEIGKTQADVIETSKTQAGVTKTSKIQAGVTKTSKTLADIIETGKTQAGVTKTSKTLADIIETSKTQAGVTKTSKTLADIIETGKTQADVTGATRTYASNTTRLPCCVTIMQVENILAEISFSLVAPYATCIEEGELTQAVDCEPLTISKATSNQECLLGITNLVLFLSCHARNLKGRCYIEALVVIHALLLGEHRTQVQENLLEIGFIAGMAEIQRDVWERQEHERSDYHQVYQLLVLHIMCEFCYNDRAKYFLLGEKSVDEITDTNVVMGIGDRVTLRIPQELCGKNGSHELLPSLLRSLKHPRDLADSDIWPLLVSMLIRFSGYPCEKMFVMELLHGTEHMLNNLTNNPKDEFIQEHGFELLGHLTESNPYAIQELSEYIAHNYEVPATDNIYAVRVGKFMDIIEDNFLFACKFIENLYLMSDRALPSFPVHLSIHENDPKIIHHMVSDESAYLVKYVISQNVLYLTTLLLLISEAKSETDKSHYVRIALTILVKANEKKQLAGCLSEVARMCRNKIYADPSLLSCFRYELSKWKDTVMPQIRRQLVQKSRIDFVFWQSTVNDLLGRSPAGLLHYAADE